MGGQTQHRPQPSGDDRLDLLPDGVVLADGGGVVTRVNAAAARLLGCRDGVGKHLSDVVLLADRAGNSWFACTDPYAGLVTRTALSEQAWYLADGTELLVTARILREGPRRPVDGVAVSLRSARARERLDRERSDLVATVAHELRSPLTGVKGFVATLLSKWDRLNDDQKKMMLETVNVDADRLTRLIAELLDVARIDTGRLSLYPRPCELTTVVDRVLASVRAGTGREISFDVDGELPAINADPDKLAQVVTNLVDNAVRHARSRVCVSLHERGNRVELYVDDDGTGIAEEDRERVFERFVRLDEARNRDVGGSGLGLAIVQTIVEVLGGAVDVGTAPIGGARFSVVLPAALKAPTHPRPTSPRLIDPPG